MTFTKEQLGGFRVALNEATLLGVEVDPVRRRAGVTLSVLTLPQEGPMPDDRRVQLLLHPVGRVAASLRHGRWDDPSAKVELFAIDGLLEIVQSFRGLPIYGWEFFDVPDEEFSKWADRLSLDFQSGLDGRTHTLDLFQEGTDRHLDLRIWFDEMTIRTPNGTVIPIDEFIAGGKRWWDAFYQKDPRTQGLGMFPLEGKE